MAEDRQEENLSLDDGDASGSLRLISKEGGIFEIERKHALISNLVKTLLDAGADWLIRVTICSCCR